RSTSGPSRCAVGTSACSPPPRSDGPQQGATAIGACAAGRPSRMLPHMAGDQPSGLAGDVIGGRYEIVEMIGRGGHGFVCRARDQRTGEAVAVKMLHDVQARDPSLIERLRREQRALMELAGTSAVRVIDLCTTASG